MGGSWRPMATPRRKSTAGSIASKATFLSKIMYGEDRLTQPLLRKKNGAFDKTGDFTPVSWDEAFTVMAEKFRAALKKGGPSAVGMFGSGQWTIWEGYAAAKLFKGGFRSNNLDPNARHCMASAAAGFLRTFGIDEPMGCYDDFEAADAFVLWGSNMAEMHPILWSRITDRRLSYPARQGGGTVHLRAPLLRAGRHPPGVQATNRPHHPQRHRQSHHQDQSRQQGASSPSIRSSSRARPTSATVCGPSTPCSRRRPARTMPAPRPISLRSVCRLRIGYTLQRAADESGVPLNRIEAVAELYAEPKPRS